MNIIFNSPDRVAVSISERNLLTLVLAFYCGRPRPTLHRVTEEHTHFSLEVEPDAVHYPPTRSEAGEPISVSILEPLREAIKAHVAPAGPALDVQASV